MKNSKTIQHNAYWYLCGIASAGAAIITHPLDLVRVQMQAQLKQISPIEVVHLIVKYRGIQGLSYGLSSSIVRQLNYSATRFGIYEIIKQYGLAENFRRRVAVSAGSGLIAGLTNVPMEKVTIQIRVDASRPPETRRNYSSLSDGLNKLYKIGGIKNLYSCALTSGFRGMALTVAQLSIYDEVKEQLVIYSSTENHWESFFFASLIAGGIAALITLPIDVVNTIGKNAEYNEFKGSCDIMKRIFHENGFRGFHKGFMPSLLRFVPQTMLTFIFYEELRMHLGQLNED